MKYKSGYLQENGKINQRREQTNGIYI